MNRQCNYNEEPAWNLSSEYPTFEDESFLKDFEKLNLIITEIKSSQDNLSVESISKLLSSRQVAIELLLCLYNFARGSVSIDSKNELAKSWTSKLIKSLTQLNSACVNFDEFLSSTDDETIQKIVTKNPAWTYHIQNERSKSSTRLSNESEKLISDLSVDGFRSWDQMYSQVCTNLKIRLSDSESVGLSKAESFLESPDPIIRKSAYEGINKAWKENEVVAASVINALAGWRIEVAKKRSEKKPYTFLDDSLERNRIQRASIDALFESISDNLVAKNAAKHCAHTLGKSSLDIWDMFAPYPHFEAKPIPFSQGFEMVKDAFSQIHPEMADFAKMMLTQNRIEARTFDGKESGGYSTGITKFKLPRILLNYAGTLQSVRVLAHELGHAFHSWCMRDLSMIEQEYPLVLAETASLLAETTLIEFVRQQGLEKGVEEQVRYANAASTHFYLLNIPARYDFEINFYEKRKEGQVTAAKLNQLMTEAWIGRYGDTTVGSNEMFWASKKHFHMSKTSIYNYPYVFGYLFSLGVYAKKAELKKDFYPAYVKLLRDTGTMKPEELAMKHLCADLTKSSFWKSALDIVQAQF